MPSFKDLEWIHQGLGSVFRLGQRLRAVVTLDSGLYQTDFNLNRAYRYLRNLQK